jgi:hypothetical protein
VITRRTAALELSFFLAIVFSFIWIWKDIPHAKLIVQLLGLGLTIGSHFLHRETPRALGFRIDNLLPALKEAAIPTLPIVGALIVLGVAGGHWASEALDPARFADLAGWAFLQQYLLQAFIHRRLAPLVAPSLARDAMVGAIFAALHLPNPILVPVTFFAGSVFATLYRRETNLWVLALCHALGSTAVAFAFDPGVLNNMRVGPGYFH